MTSVNGQPPHPLQVQRWIRESAIRYGATATEAAVLGAITLYMHEPDGPMWPTVPEIMRITGYSRATILRARIDLRDLGLLTWDTHTQGSHKPTVYRIDHTRLCVPPDRIEATTP